jgi:hypothetical protein
MIDSKPLIHLYFVKFTAFFSGCLFCYLLQTQAHLSAVSASALAAFASTFVPLPKNSDHKGIHSALYAGTFTGMCSPHILRGPIEIALISALGTALYLAFKPHFGGLGGRLGAIAFITSLFFFLAQRHL